jgi:hypothetical protein
MMRSLHWRATTLTAAATVPLAVLLCQLEGGATTLIGTGQGTPVARADAVFCAHGGVGRWPADQPRPYFALVVGDLDVPSPATSPLGVAAFTLSDAANSTAASLVAVEEVVTLRVEPPSSLVATYLNPPGTPLLGPLPRGITRVRIRVSRSCASHARDALPADAHRPGHATYGNGTRRCGMADVTRELWGRNRGTRR